MNGQNYSEANANALGRVQAKMDNVEERIDAMSDDIREVRDFMRSAQSNWKLLMAMCTISAAIGGVVSKTLAYLGLTH